MIKSFELERGNKSVKAKTGHGEADILAIQSDIVNCKFGWVNREFNVAGSCTCHHVVNSYDSIDSSPRCIRLSIFGLIIELLSL
jgi:hypothetical protein